MADNLVKFMNHFSDEEVSYLLERLKNELPNINLGRLPFVSRELALDCITRRTGWWDHSSEVYRSLKRKLEMRHYKIVPSGSHKHMTICYISNQMVKYFESKKVTIARRKGEWWLERLDLETDMGWIRGGERRSAQLKGETVSGRYANPCAEIPMQQIRGTHSTVVVMDDIEAVDKKINQALQDKVARWYKATKHLKDLVP